MSNPPTSLLRSALSQRDWRIWFGVIVTVFWIGGGVSSWSGRDDSDFRAVQAGYVSVTPLHLDLTNYRLISEVRSWMQGG